MNRLHAYYLGLTDVIDQGGELSSGITWPDNQDWNEAYDRGANLGELLYRVWNPVLDGLERVRHFGRRVRQHLP